MNTISIGQNFMVWHIMVWTNVTRGFLEFNISVFCYNKATELKLNEYCGRIVLVLQLFQLLGNFESSEVKTPEVASVCANNTSH